MALGRRIDLAIKSVEEGLTGDEQQEYDKLVHEHAVENAVDLWRVSRDRRRKDGDRWLANHQLLGMCEEFGITWAEMFAAYKARKGSA